MGREAGAPRGGLPPLMLISDVERVGEERFLSALVAAARAGLGMVQLREPSWPEDPIRDLAARIKVLLGREGLGRTLVLANRRPRLAVELSLDGVHVGGGDPLQVARSRALVGAGLIVGYSAHSVGEIAEAARAGADYVTYSPIFSPISKRMVLPPAGIEGLREACSAATIPVFALGGIRPEHAPALMEVGAAGAAMVGSILDASDPGGAVRAFLEGWPARG